MKNKENTSKHILIAVLASLCVHIGIFSLMEPLNPSPPNKKVKKLVVRIHQKKQRNKKRQIVSQNKAMETTIPTETTFLDDKNKQTPKEQIKRGQGQIAKSSPRNKQIAKKTPSPTKSKKISMTKKFPLKDGKQYKKVVSVKKIRQNDYAKASSQPLPLDQLSPATALVSSNSPGSSDFLPQIKNGEITLLNTKAERYAIFVRRVAGRVFKSLRISSRKELGRRELLGPNKVIFRAIMNPKGKLINLIKTSSSGTDRFDSIVKSSIEGGVWDYNPPLSAAQKDGNIHFELQAWFTQKHTGLGTKRWLILSTGLL